MNLYQNKKMNEYNFIKGGLERFLEFVSYLQAAIDVYKEEPNPYLPSHLIDQPDEYKKEVLNRIAKAFEGMEKYDKLYKKEFGKLCKGNGFNKIAAFKYLYYAKEFSQVYLSLLAALVDIDPLLFVYTLKKHFDDSISNEASFVIKKGAEQIRSKPFRDFLLGSNELKGKITKQLYERAEGEIKERELDGKLDFLLEISQEHLVTLMQPNKLMGWMVGKGLDTKKALLLKPDLAELTEEINRDMATGEELALIREARIKQQNIDFQQNHYRLTSYEAVNKLVNVNAGLVEQKDPLRALTYACQKLGISTTALGSKKIYQLTPQQFEQVKDFFVKQREKRNKVALIKLLAKKRSISERRVYAIIEDREKKGFTFEEIIKKEFGLGRKAGDSIGK